MKTNNIVVIKPPLTTTLTTTLNSTIYETKIHPSHHMAKNT